MHSQMKSVGATIAVLAALAAWAGGDEYHQRTPDQKRAQDELLFLLTFDGFNARADVAKGGGDSFAAKDLDLGLKGVIGFDRRNAYRAEPDEFLRFPGKGNFNPHDGTLVCWVNARGYDPTEKATDGKSRGNVMLATLDAREGPGERGMMMHLYEYEDTLYFDWTTTPKAYKFGEYARVKTTREGIRKGEWHQIVATWNNKKIALYLNGEKRAEHQLPPRKVEEFANLMPGPYKNSHVGIRAGGWGDRNEVDVAVDDIAVYSRAWTDIEVRNSYLALLKNPGDRRPRAFEVRLNGVTSGPTDKVDRIEAEFDLSGLSPDAKKRLANGGLELKGVLRGPDGRERSCTTRLSSIRSTKVFKDVDMPGKWTFEAEIDGAKESAEIVRPEMPWLGNGIGEEDIVPELWREFEVKDRTVTLWNRTYVFGEGPLPVEVKAFGGPLLASRPKLLVDGAEPVWKAGPTERRNRFAVFTGTGVAGAARISYRTTVEFDGMIKFDWTVEGNPAIGSMCLEWQVRPESSRWLMTPELCEAKGDPVRFAYPCRMLWLVSERRGGFAYSQVNDANWVYDKDAKIFSADRATGKCRVDIISRRVERMPDATPYTALFIATPTRPLPRRNRVLRWGFGAPGGIKLVHSSGEGLFNSSFTHAPQECAAFDRRYGRCAADSISVYGAVKSLTVSEPEALYLHKYWERPGAYEYMMHLWEPGPDGKLVRKTNAARSACASTVYSDYLVWCDWRLWTHPLGDRFAQSYFDLCGVGQCANELHGCRYVDMFGRKVTSYDVLTLRRLLMRLVSLAHRFGKTVILHGQRSFLPFAQGLADYWFPGEQNSAMLLRNLYGYTDDVSDAIFRTELNRDVLGVGVLHLPAVGQACRQKKIEWEKEDSWKYTWAMLAKLQLHDIETCELWCAGKPVRRLWDVLARHRLDDPGTRCHLYHEQSEVVSSDEKVRVTWYDCVRGEKLLVVANLTPEDRQATIDTSRLGRYAAGADELHGTAVRPQENGFSVVVPSRDMLMVPLKAVK